jgi:hypothetical protein
MPLWSEVNSSRKEVIGMARKKKNAPLPTTPEGLINTLLTELQKDEPNEPLLDSARIALLEMGDDYVPALMDRIRACADERESADLSLVVHVMGDPQLIAPLRDVALDPDNSLSARITASVGLKAYGINVKLDFLPLADASDDEAMEAIDRIADAMNAAQESREGLDSIVSMLAMAPPDLLEVLFVRLASRHGEAAAAVFAYLAQHAEPDLALPTVKALAHLHHPIALRILQQVVEQSVYPNVSQEARRAIFRLCQQGVAEMPQDAEDIPLPTDERWSIERAVLSNVDGVGSRLLFVHCALPNGNDAWVQLCLNDVVGLKDCAGKECPPEEIEEDFKFLKKMKDEGLILADADPNYCHWLIVEARQKNQHSHFPLPIGCHTWLAPLSAPPVRYEQPLIYNLLDVSKIKDAEELLEESDLLLDEPSLESWVFRFDDIRPFAERARSSARGLGGLPFGMVGVVAEDVLEEAMSALLTDERRALLRRRLEEVAYVFYQRNKKKLARQCLVTAQALTSEAFELMEIPFAVQMVANSISAGIGALMGHYSPEGMNASPWDPIK